jgi:hypothetical protein
MSLILVNYCARLLLILPAEQNVLLAEQCKITAFSEKELLTKEKKDCSAMQT